MTGRPSLLHTQYHSLIVYQNKGVFSSVGPTDWRFATNMIFFLRQLFLKQLLGGLCMCVLEQQRIWGSVF